MNKMNLKNKNFVGGGGGGGGIPTCHIPPPKTIVKFFQ